MKLVKEIPDQDWITPDQVTMEHLIVGISSSNTPYLLSSLEYNRSEYKWLAISDGLTEGNGLYLGNTNFEYILGWGLNNFRCVEVFKQEDWKQALQWLIDNV